LGDTGVTLPTNLSSDRKPHLYVTQSAKGRTHLGGFRLIAVAGMARSNQPHLRIALLLVGQKLIP